MKGGQKPQESTFWHAANASYDKIAPNQIGFLAKMIDTPTIDIQVNPPENTFLIAVRGTYDFRDVRTDAVLPINALRFTRRYRGDVAIIRQITQKYPPTQYEYYLAGHSLGGAIIRQLKRDFPFFRDAVVYNGAQQPYDLISRGNKDVASRQVDTDPLYILGGRFFSNKVVVPQISKSRIFAGHDMINFAPLQQGTGKINPKQVPEGLSPADKRKQERSIKQGTRRPSVDYPKRKSKWTTKAIRFFGEDRSKRDVADKLAEYEGKTKRRANTIYKALDEIMNRGEGAYRSAGSRPNTSPEQWSVARMYSVLFGGPARNRDADIVKKYKLPLLPSP